MSESKENSAIDDLDWSDVQDELKESVKMAEESRAAQKEADAAQESAPEPPPPQEPIKPASPPPPPPEPKPAPKREVGAMQFGELQNTGQSQGALDLDFILEIPLKVSAELGRSRMLVGDLLALGTGSIIELDKAAGEPVDIFVNNRLIARGEVVVANEKFGIRLTDVVSHSERVNNLK